MLATSRRGGRPGRLSWHAVVKKMVRRRPPRRPTDQLRRARIMKASRLEGLRMGRSLSCWPNSGHPESHPGGLRLRLVRRRASRGRPPTLVLALASKGAAFDTHRRHYLSRLPGARPAAGFGSAYCGPRKAGSYAANVVAAEFVQARALRGSIRPKSGRRIHRPWAMGQLAAGHGPPAGGHGARPGGQTQRFYDRSIWSVFFGHG